MGHGTIEARISILRMDFGVSFDGMDGWYFDTLERLFRLAFRNIEWTGMQKTQSAIDIILTALDTPIQYQH